MARALGAKVYAGSHKEIGWSPVMLSDAGMDSCLSPLVGDRTAVLHWHGDTFDLPKDATLLASTPLYQNQAFSWGQGWLALQFHPEVTAYNLERWFVGHAHEISMTPDVSISLLRQETKSYAPNLQLQAAKVWHTWLREVSASGLE